MKKKVCILAFDDSPHKKSDLQHNREHFFDSSQSSDVNESESIPKVKLIGVVCRGCQLLHVSQSFITVDGVDSTREIIRHYMENPYRKEIRLIMIDSPTLAAFNCPNPFEIFEQTHVPVVLLPDETPNSKIGEVYPKVFPNRKEQIRFLQQLPPLEELTVHVNSDSGIKRTIYFHCIGITKADIHELLEYLSEYSAIPEPLRMAHIIASQSVLKP